MNILDTLTKQQLELFVSKKVKEGSTLFKENDYCHHIGIVKSGQISIISFFGDGQTIKYNSIKENGMFGNNLIFSSNSRYKGDVIAQKDSEILLINKEDLIQLMRDNDAFMAMYLKIQADFVKTLNDRIKLLAIGNAQQRLLYYLKVHNNIIQFESVSQLAKELSLSREALSRTISKLQKANIIIKDTNSIKRLS